MLAHSIFNSRIELILNEIDESKTRAYENEMKLYIVHSIVPVVVSRPHRQV
jgi:hypothetical protein